MRSGSNRVWVAGSHEAADVTRLLLAFRDWFGASQPSEQSMASSVARLLDDPTTEYLLGTAAAAERPSGVCQLRFRHSVWTGTPDCWLEDLFVDEQARGLGLGVALVELAVARANLRGAQRIELDTNEDNIGAIALYESLGFSAKSKAHGALRGRDVFMGRRVA